MHRGVYHITGMDGGGQAAPAGAARQIQPPGPSGGTIGAAIG